MSTERSQCKQAWSATQNKRGAPPPERVQVVCRVRPSEEYGEQCVSITPGDGGDLVSVAGLSREFTASRAFGEDSTQEDVFEFVGKPSLDYVLRGFGACIFAYGQTGSGKTFTMTGARASPGLIPRMIHVLFSELVCEYGDFAVTVEYLEVYMEKVRDLFTPTRARNPWDAPGPKLNVRYDGKRVQVENAKRLSFGDDASLRKSFQSDKEFAEALTKKLLFDVETAGRHRVVRGHALNAESSRSHAVLNLEVTARRPGQEISSNLMLVDLAGSENIGKAQVEGIGREEAKAINKSLFSLTRCIDALANGQKVPFRESVLTKLLTPALDGRSCCTLIAALRGDHASETRETLKFMETAVRIAVKPKQTSSEALGVVQEQAHGLRDEIEALKQEIEFLRRSEKDSASLQSMVAEKEELLRSKMALLAELQRDIRDTEDQLAHVQRELDASKTELERERATRIRIEGENVLLAAKLREAETRNHAESEMHRLRAQKRFHDRRRDFLSEIAAAADESCVEDCMQSFVRLMRLLHEDLAARLDDQSHHASLTLLENLRLLGDRVQTSVESWAELQAGFSELQFVGNELDTHKRHIDSLHNEESRLHYALGDYQAVLQEVCRLSESAVRIVNGAAQVAKRAESSCLKKDAGVQALLHAIVDLFAGSTRQWKAYKLMWLGHWRFKVDLDDAGIAVEGGLVTGDMSRTHYGQMALHEIVTLVAEELEKLFQVFAGKVSGMLLLACSASFATPVDEVQNVCVIFLQRQVDAVGEQDGVQMKQIANDCQSTIVQLTEARRAGFHRSMLQALGERWKSLKDTRAGLSSDGNVDGTALATGFDALRRQVEDALRYFQAHNLCEKDVFQRCLTKPTTTFVRDVLKLLHYSSSLFQNGAIDASSWNDCWTQEHPGADVKRKFFDAVCEVVANICQNKGWDGCADINCSHWAATTETDKTGNSQCLFFMGQVCIATELAEAEQPSVANEILARNFAFGEFTAEFMEWVQGLKTRVRHITAGRRQEMEHRLATSTQDVEAMHETMKNLRAELHQTQAENQQLIGKLQTSSQECERESQAHAVAVQELREEADFWHKNADDAGERMATMQVELDNLRSRQTMRPEDADLLAKQLGFIALLLCMIREMQDSLATAEGGQEVQDVVTTLEKVLKKHHDALRQLAGQAPEGKMKMNLMNVADFISNKRAGKKIRDAKAFARSQTAPANSDTVQIKAGGALGGSNYVDEASADLCDRLHMVLLALAEQHATVGAVRLEQERSLIAYMRSSLKKAWERRQNLSAQVLQLQGALRTAECRASEGDGHQVQVPPSHPVFTEHGWSPAAYRALAMALRAVNQAPELIDLKHFQFEFCKIKALIENAGSKSVSLAVHRVRKVKNPDLEADFYDAIADLPRERSDETEPTIITSVFHGTSSRICEVISHEGFRLPRELGSKAGPFGNAIYFANHATNANAHCTVCPGRLRSLLVCDIVPGRVLPPDLTEAQANMSAMGLEQVRCLSRPDGGQGYDSVFVPGSFAGPGASQDEYAIYDPRIALPRYIVDFDIAGLGSEAAIYESEEVSKLRADISELREQGGNVQVSTLRTKLQLLSEVVHEIDVDTRLVAVERSQEPALWDRCAKRVQQAAEDGPGLGFGLEAVMTRLERILNPNLASQFYACASNLFYPEEPFQLLLCGTSGADVHQIVEHGFAPDLPNDGRSADQLFGRGVYFATSTSMFSGNVAGSHRLFLCEVALGKAMIAQSARPNMDADALKRAGFDSLRAPRRSEEEGDEWVVYNSAQALPVYLVSYDVQPKAVASQLLREVLSLEERRRLLDEQMAALLQELEDTRRASDETRVKLDEGLAQQLVDEETNLLRAKKENKFQQERLDNQRAAQLQELEKAELEVRQLRNRASTQQQPVEWLPAVQTPPRRISPPASPPSVGQTIPTAGRQNHQQQDPQPQSGFARNFSLPSLRARR